MTFRDVMEMPIKSFWVFNKNINRIQAEEDIRAMKNMITSQSSDAFKERVEALIEAMGQPMVYIDNRRDPNATNNLRNLLTG